MSSLEIHVEICLGVQEILFIPSIQEHIFSNEFNSNKFLNKFSCA